MRKPANPFSSMLVSLAPDLFFGRQDHVEIIKQGIRKPQSFSIYGNKTIGKTSLLNYLKHIQLGNENNDLIYIDFYSITGAQTLAWLHQGLLESKTVQSTLGPLPNLIQPSERSKAEIKGAINQLFGALHEKGLRLIVCMDHFGEAYRSLEYEDDVYLRNLATNHVLIIATAKTLPELRQDPRRTSPLITILQPRHLGLLSEDEAREFLTTPTEGSPIRFTDYEIDFLISTAGCQPYLLTLAAEYLFNLHTEYSDLAHQIDQEPRIHEQVTIHMGLLPAITELFQLFWNALNLDERRVLSSIARDEDVPVETMQPVLNALQNASLLSADLLTGQYQIFSELFRRFTLQQVEYSQRPEIESILPNLTHLDRRLLEYLMSRPNQLCSFEELLENIWEDRDASRRGLEASIHRLRSQIQSELGEDWEYIQNVRGKGFKYVPKIGTK